MLRIVVFASGRGSNARNIFALATQHPQKISVQALVTNHAKAGVLTFAKEYNIPSFVVPIRDELPKEQRRAKHEEDIERVLKEFSYDYICLAGYMRIFFIRFYRAASPSSLACFEYYQYSSISFACFSGTVWIRKGISRLC